MKINIENMVRHCGAKEGYQFSLECLIKDLKELRERSKAGDKTAIDEFFKLYVFDGNQ